MDAKEHEALLKTQARFFGSVTPDLKFDLEFIRRIHDYFFGGLYSWAGRYRTLNLAKDGFVWPPAKLVAQNMEIFEREFLGKHTPCLPGPIEAAAQAIAVVHAEFLLVHPFREGNGRVARLIAGMMALQAGHAPPDFRFRSAKNRAKYIEAVKSGYSGDYRGLAELIERAIRRTEARLKGGGGGV